MLDVVYFETAAIVVEIVSPDDETFAKLPFYVAHGVDEVLVIELDERRVVSSPGRLEPGGSGSGSTKAST